jgi:hypothetical protein
MRRTVIFDRKGVLSRQRTNVEGHSIASVDYYRQNVINDNGHRMSVTYIRVPAYCAVVTMLSQVLITHIVLFFITFSSI